MDSTAWGKITLNAGTATGTQTMPTDLSTIGIVEEDSFAIETEAGEKIQLFGSGHVLVDQKQLENIETLSCRVIVPTLAQITQFWDVTKIDSDGEEKYAVHSTVGNEHIAIQFLPELVGAIMLEAPRTDPACQLTFEEKKGWVLDMSFTVITVTVVDGKPVKFYLSKKTEPTT